MLRGVGTAAAIGTACVRALSFRRFRNVALFGEPAGLVLLRDLFTLLFFAELLLFLAGVFGDAVGVGGAAGSADALLFRLFCGAFGGLLTLDLVLGVIEAVPEVGSVWLGPAM